MDIKPADKRRLLTVMTGWGEGRKVTLVDFAHGNHGLAIQNVGASTSIISAIGGDGDAIIKMGEQQMYCDWKNLDPMPCRILLVKGSDYDSFDDVKETLDTLHIVSDLGLKFLPNYRHDHMQMLKRAKQLSKPHNFSWWHWCRNSATCILGVNM